MSGGGGGRTYTGSGDGTPDECAALDVETPLNSPNPQVVKTLQKQEDLDIAVQVGARGVNTLVAKKSNGQIAGSLTPPSLLTIISCIGKGYQYVATVLEVPAGGVVRVRIHSK